MAKCIHCNGCFKTTWVDNKVYRYCSLCQKAYRLEGGELILETSERINKIIFSSPEGKRV